MLKSSDDYWVDRRFRNIQDKQQRGTGSQMVANQSNEFYAEESEKYPIIFQQ
jgi:hypothetical protein